MPLGSSFEIGSHTILLKIDGFVQKLDLKYHPSPLNSSIIECLNGQDENCLSSWKTKIIVLLCAYLIVVMGWCYNYYKVYDLMRSHVKQPEIVKTAEPYFQIVKRELSEEFPSEDISELKGDSAAYVKVRT